MSAIADIAVHLMVQGCSPDVVRLIVGLAEKHAEEIVTIVTRSSQETSRDARDAKSLSAARSKAYRYRKRVTRHVLPSREEKGGSLLLTSLLPSFLPEEIKEEETRKKEESKKERAREAELSESFGLFWGRWPNKVGKPVALKALRSALKRACHAEIMAGVENYIRDKPPDRPWLNPATFLNQSRWEDQPATVNISKPLTEFQRKQAETNDVRAHLRDMANGGRSGGQTDRVLPIDHGERSEDVRGWPGPNILALPRASRGDGS